MVDAIVDPTTGELINADDLAELRDVERRIEEHFRVIREDNRHVYRERDKLRARIAELQGAAHVSSVPARWRSDTQQKVLRCPHCGQVAA